MEVGVGVVVDVDVGTAVFVGTGVDVEVGSSLTVMGEVSTMTGAASGSPTEQAHQKTINTQIMKKQTLRFVRIFVITGGIVSPIFIGSLAKLKAIQINYSGAD